MVILKHESKPKRNLGIKMKNSTFVPNKFFTSTEESIVVSSTRIKSNYIGWVLMDVGDLLQNLKPKHNHGFFVTVHDTKNYTWHAPSIFVTMDCKAGNNTSENKMSLAATACFRRQ